MLQDLRYALRAARRAPGFAAIVVGTLALGIGVNTAVFSAVNAVLLRKPPYTAPERLVSVHQRFPKMSELIVGTSPAEYLDYRDRNRAFSSVAGYENQVFDLTGGAEPERVEALSVTQNLFSTLGVAPMLGRTFTAEEDRPGGAAVAVVSHEFWERHFGGNARAVGSVVRLNERPYTIVGVMPRGFEFPFTAASAGTPPALWIPVAFSAERIADRMKEFPVRIVARLKPGVSREQAQADVTRVAGEFQKEHPDLYTGNLRLEARATPLGERDAARARPVLLALGGAVLFVLLIACANVANLLLARAASRQREVAVRRALGAGTGRLAAQFLTEGLLYAAAGGALGWALAGELVRAAPALWPSTAAALPELTVDGAVLAFTAAVSALAGVICGLAPALAAGRERIGEALKSAGRQGTMQGGRRVRRALVVVETASAVTLLIAAGLLVHSLTAVLRVPAGFSPEGVLIARTAFNPGRYPSSEARRAAERLMEERIAALPGVAAVGLTTHIPLADERQIGYVLEGEDIRSARWADNAMVDGGYFPAMGIPIVKGRAFNAEDRPGAPLAAVVNESTARRLWPGGDAIGRVILWGGRKMIVRGVAGDVHVRALDAAVGTTIYTSAYQVESAGAAGAVFVVRARPGHAAGLAAAVREAIRSVDRGVPVFDMRGMEQIVARSLAERRFAAGVLSAFAALALGLAVLGLYGVLSYAVAQRTAELGLRMALGASPRDALRLVLGDGLRLTAAGAGLGLAAGAAGARALSGMLFGVGPLDPAAFAGAAGALAAVAAVACYVPAARAARVDPMVALRQE